MTLSRFIVRQTIGGGVINAVLNGPVAIVIMREDTTWHLWRGFPSLVLDILGVAFGIAWGTGWLFTPQLRKQIASGRLVAPEVPASWRVAFSQWPASSMHRGINLGGLAVLVFALPTIAALFWLGVESWGRWPVIAFKTAFGLVIGAVFTPLVAASVLAEPPPVIEAIAPVEERLEG